MNSFHKSFPSLSSCLFWSLATVLAHPALCETKPRASAQELLEKARQSEYERKLAAKQTALDRLAEDLKKGKEQADGLEKMIDTLGSAVTEANGHFDELTALRRIQPKVMEVISLKLEAEGLRVEGLKLLRAAQTKTLDALAKRNEEIDLRTALSAAEMRLFAKKSLGSSAGPEILESGPNKPLSLTEQRRALEKAERAAETAETIAREAMQTASSRLRQADAAAAKAENRRVELGIEEIPSVPVEKRGVEPSPKAAPAKDRSRR